MEQGVVFWIGIFAAFCITTANLPQAWKIIRTGDTESISRWTYSLLVTGNAAWLWYGVLKADVPLIIANSISTLLCALILLFKLFPATLALAQRAAGKRNS